MNSTVNSQLSPLVNKQGSLDDLPINIAQALAGTIEQDRLDIQPDTTIDENVISVDQLVFHPGGTLTFQEEGHSYVLVRARRLIFQDGNILSSINLEKPPVRHGNDGTPGAKGSNGTSAGAPGKDGDDGTDGEIGKSGFLLPPFILLVEDSIEFQSIPGTGKSPLALHCEGVDGGSGGDGGMGGKGGNGKKGRPGRAHYEFDSGGPITFGGFICLSRPTNGGDAGHGGASGKSGDGAPGGPGGDIYLVGPADVLKVTESFLIYNEGGVAGEGGEEIPGSAPGKPGAAGDRAPSCRSARAGRKGKVGASGSAGTDAEDVGDFGKITLIAV